MNRIGKPKVAILIPNKPGALIGIDNVKPMDLLRFGEKISGVFLTPYTEFLDLVDVVKKNKIKHFFTIDESRMIAYHVDNQDSHGMKREDINGKYIIEVSLDESKKNSVCFFDIDFDMYWTIR